MADLGEIDDLLGRLLRRVERYARYAEVMAEMTEGRFVRYDRSATVVQPTPKTSGAVFRAWGPQGWWEVSRSGLEPAGLEEAAEAMIQRIGYGAGASDPPGPSATSVADVSTKAANPVSKVALEEQVALAQTWFAWATEVPGVRNAYVGLGTVTEERLFRSTAGARVRQRIERVRGSVTSLAVENSRVEYDFVGCGGAGGSEILDQITQERVTSSAKEAVALLRTSGAPSGSMKVLLDPSTAGTFAHESFGHGAEADQMIRDRSYLKPLLGQMVGPESLTIVDDGSLPGEWGSIFFDDEGNASRRTVLVDHGRFAEALHDRESAAALGRKPTGNTRRADFLSRPFVRMTNTFVEPGAMSLDELLETMRDGVILESCTSGIEDPLGGNMQIKVKKGHRVRGGEIGELLPSMALSGKVLDVLRSIQGVGGKSEFKMSPGMCGKGHTDLLPTGTGGSYLLAEATVGPA